LYKDNERISSAEALLRQLNLAIISLLDTFGKYLLENRSRHIPPDGRAPSEPECPIHTETGRLYLSTIVAPLLPDTGAISSCPKELAIPTNNIAATLNMCISDILKDATRELEHEMPEKESCYQHLFSGRPF
jgi:hypothetical protein